MRPWIDLSTLSFGEPLYLWLLAVPGGLLVLWVWQVFRRRADERRVTRDRVLPVVERHPLLGGLFFWVAVALATMLCILALARPVAHAEMHQQALAGSELHDQVFGSALDRANGLPLQLGGESRRERMTKYLPPDDHPSEASARHRAVQPAACVFDFRQLGHAIKCTGATLAGYLRVSFARERGRPILLIATAAHLCRRAAAVRGAISSRRPRSAASGCRA